ncbi:MAG: hypothetical protein V1746_02995 [bacterium]
MNAQKSNCRLCLQPKPLKSSHVVPDFFIQGIEYEKGTGQGNIPQPHVILLSKQENIFKPLEKQRGSWEGKLGIKEKLFCGECERKLSLYEDYTRKFLYGNVSQPIKKLLLGQSIFQKYPRRLAFSDRRLVTGIDYLKFKLFQISLLWRLSLSFNFKKIVDLDRHQERMRTTLLSGSFVKWEMYPCIMIDLQREKSTFEDIFQLIDKFKDEGLWCYRMVAGGYLWWFEVSNHKVSKMASDLALQENGEMKILVADPFPIIQEWRTSAKNWEQNNPL